jgi:hypothetical protein
MKSSREVAIPTEDLPSAREGVTALNNTGDDPNKIARASEGDHPRR